MSGPVQVGEFVKFVINDEGDVRPALIVRTWGPVCANLHVFWDGSNDWDIAWKLGCGNYPSALERSVSPWVTSASYEHSGNKRTFYRDEDAHIVANARAARLDSSKPGA